ncbi:pirin family protein [Bryobacter aggregatus]|uniref:pirin family protein n=1 Tax=Bryobacter aggregatus TaxID=360054 RepID=UPI0004E1164D|nr:pirin family protein [Bryobacter aggregatus]
MITVRPAAERGHANHGWLDSHHTFSFADYFDPKHVQFRSLRVLNEDKVAGGRGFGKHPHRDMEILTWVQSGTLEHADDLGNKRVLQPGELQAMSAGTGVVHSEYNPSITVPVHFFQIWILPDRKNIAPVYAQETFAAEQRKGRFQLLASPNGAAGSIPINADAKFSVIDLAHGQSASYPVAAGRGVWVQVASGEVDLNGRKLSAGDGAAIEDESALQLKSLRDAQVLLFDVQ